MNVYGNEHLWQAELRLGELRREAALERYARNAARASGRQGRREQTEGRVRRLRARWARAA